MLAVASFYLGNYVVGGTDNYARVDAVGVGSAVLELVAGATQVLVRSQYNDVYFNCGVISGGTPNWSQYNDVKPPNSTAYSLGASNAAWRYLYMSDGTDEWRIEINTSGALVMTKV